MKLQMLVTLFEEAIKTLQEEMSSSSFKEEKMHLSTTLNFITAAKGNINEVLSFRKLLTGDKVIIADSKTHQIRAATGNDLMKLAIAMEELRNGNNNERDNQTFRTGTSSEQGTSQFEGITETRRSVLSVLEHQRLS